MKKDAYYFSHDSNARNDEDILKLRVSLGWAGYGLYWALVECLRDANAYRLQCDYKTIAYNLHCESSLVESIINDFNLFVVDNNCFYSESLNRRMKLKEEKSQKARESANKRWGNNANEMRTHNERNAKKVKESKRKEKKVNKKEFKYPISQALEKNMPKDYKELFISWLSIYFEIHGKMTEASQEMQFRILMDIPKRHRIKCLEAAIAGQWKNIKYIINENNTPNDEIDKIMENSKSAYDPDFQEETHDMPEIAI